MQPLIAMAQSDPRKVRLIAPQALIDLLAGTPARRRIAVLGEMLELGAWSESLHREVGEYAAERGIDVVAGVKGDAAALADAAASAPGHKTEVMFFDTPAEAGRWLRSIVLEGDAILFKGSRGTRVEEALAAFMESD